MKTKTVVIVFENNLQKNDAEDFLLKLNINFQGILRKPIIFVSQNNFKKHYLDLLLNFKTVASIYK